MENMIYKLYLINGIIAFIGLLFFGLVIFQRIKKKREIDFSYNKLYSYFMGFLVLSPVILALYFIPVALYNKDFWLDSNLQF